jgi:hypothetical protein
MSLHRFMCAIRSDSRSPRVFRSPRGLPVRALPTARFEMLDLLDLTASNDDHQQRDQGVVIMGRREQRASRARYRREASQALLTYLVDAHQPLDVPILRNAARSWLDALSARARGCIVCSGRLWSRQSVGLLLLSTPTVVRPTSASVCGICNSCAELPLPALEQAATAALQEAVPGGSFEALETRR